MNTGKVEEEQLKRPELGADVDAVPPASSAKPGEIGGPKGPEPTRYGDWERRGRCIDF